MKRKLKPVVAGRGIKVNDTSSARLIGGLALDVMAGKYRTVFRLDHGGRTLVIELTARRK